MQFMHSREFHINLLISDDEMIDNMFTTCRRLEIAQPLIKLNFSSILVKVSFFLTSKFFQLRLPNSSNEDDQRQEAMCLSILFNLTRDAY